jgi:hypothetical protein
VGRPVDVTAALKAVDEGGSAGAGDAQPLAELHRPERLTRRRQVLQSGNVGGADAEATSQGERGVVTRLLHLAQRPGRPRRLRATPSFRLGHLTMVA